MWGIQDDFSNCTSKKDPSAKVQIEFHKKKFDGWVTIAREKRRTPAYRLWYSDLLSYELKDVFLMSFIRDIEDRLRKAKGDRQTNIEDEIPFWEFWTLNMTRTLESSVLKHIILRNPRSRNSSNDLSDLQACIR